MKTFLTNNLQIKYLLCVIKEKNIKIYKKHYETTIINKNKFK